MDTMKHNSSLTNKLFIAGLIVSAVVIIAVNILVNFF
jgi:hypothetical protein